VKRWVRFFALAMLAGFAGAQCHASKMIRVTVHVMNESGTAIANSHVDVVFADRHTSGETDSQGNFKIRMRPDAWGDLTVEAPAYEAYVHRHTNFGNGNGGAYTVSLEPQTVPLAKLSGHVQDRSGMNLAGADVRVKIANHEVARESTDANGTFSFDGDAGTYDVTITLQKAARPQSLMVTFAAGHPSTIVFKIGDTAGWEYGALIQGGIGLEQNSSFKFLLAGGHLGKVLTPEYGHNMLKGDFEYAVEVFPFWNSYTPTFQRLNCPAGATVASQCKGPTTTGGTYRGVSITPIILRWNLTSWKKWMPWLQGAGGVLYTTRKYPGIGSLNVADPTQTGPSADTSVWNFTPQFGIGAHYFMKPKRSIDFSANAVHISSASLGDKNPGVNTGVQFSVGYTWWK